MLKAILRRRRKKVLRDPSELGVIIGLILGGFLVARYPANVVASAVLLCSAVFASRLLKLHLLASSPLIMDRLFVKEREQYKLSPIGRKVLLVVGVFVLTVALGSIIFATYLTLKVYTT